MGWLRSFSPILSRFFANISEQSGWLLFDGPRFLSDQFTQIDAKSFDFPLARLTSSLGIRRALAEPEDLDGERLLSMEAADTAASTVAGYAALRARA
jgi:hypothetical protein